MKNLFLILILGLVSLFVSSCSSTPNKEDNEIGGGGEKKLTIPCINNSFDDDNNFNELGMAAGKDQSKIRNVAIEDAQGNIKRKLNGLVRRVSENYLESISAKSDNSGTERIIADIITTTVEKVLADASKICEENTVDNLGIYHTYIALRIPKEKLSRELSKQIQENEELKTKFNREEFRKYAEEQLKKYREYSNNK